MKFLTAIIAFFILFGAESRAADGIYYYLELGDEPDQKAAAAKWEKLSQAHKDILGKLTFHPTIILRSDRSVIVRVHAGPVENKATAQNMCLQLFARQAQCFILEGGRYPYSGDKPMSPVKSNEGLPWMEGLVPWLFSDRENSAAAGEPQVEVAEAIHVPLKEDPQPRIRPVFVPGASLPEAKVYAPRDSGWADVRPFKDEAAAIALWQSARSASPERATGLRVRIIRPALAQDTAEISLNIGPFSTEQEALEFCRAVIIPVNAGIVCRFTQQEAVAAKPLPMGIIKTPVAVAAPLSAIKGYWVQVAAGGSREEAASAWETLYKVHTDLLGDYTGNIAAPFMGGNSYTVRVGPFPSNAEAVGLCVKLRQRGIHCRAYDQ